MIIDLMAVVLAALTLAETAAIPPHCMREQPSKCIPVWCIKEQLH